MKKGILIVCIVVLGVFGLLFGMIDYSELEEREKDEVIEEMVHYNYAKLRDVQNDKFPFSAESVQETDNYGIYFWHSSGGDNQIYKTTDEGVTVESVIEVSGFGRFFYLQGSNQLWYFLENGNVYYIELDNSDNVIDTGNPGSFVPTSGFAMDISHDDTNIQCVKLFEDGGDTGNFLMRWYAYEAETWNLKDTLDTGIGVGNEFLVSFLTRVGANFYFIGWEDSQSTTDIYLYTVGTTTISQVKEIATSKLIPDYEGQWGIAYDGSNILYFVLRASDDSDNVYLYSYVISTDVVTRLAKRDISLMADRFSIGTVPPFSLEKAFGKSVGVDDLIVFQIPLTNTGTLRKISDLTNNSTINSGVIIAITDKYLWIKETDGNIELWKFQDMDQYIRSAIIWHGVRDYPVAELIFDSDNLDLQTGMFFQFIGKLTTSGGTEDPGVRFEGYVTKVQDWLPTSTRMKIATIVSPAREDLRKSPGTPFFVYIGDSDAIITTFIGEMDYITVGTLVDGQEFGYGYVSFRNKGDFQQIIDEMSAGESFIWYLSTQGALQRNTGAVDSTVNYDDTNAPKIYRVSKVVRDEFYNRVDLKGGYLGDNQIEADTEDNVPSQQEVGIKDISIVVPWIIHVDDANAFIVDYLALLSATPDIITFTVLDTTNGMIPPGETITFESNNKGISSFQAKVLQVMFNDRTGKATYIVCSEILYGKEDFQT